MRRLVFMFTALSVGPLAAKAAIAQPAVLVWPQTPETMASSDLGNPDPIQAAGFRAIDFAVIAKVLATHQRTAETSERRALEAVQSALDAAQSAYLEQRFDDMLLALAPLHGDALDVLARPAHRGTLWQVEFTLGLAYQARGRKGDEKLAGEYFLRALTVQPDRRPDSALYGPDVTGAFARAVASRSKLVARPVRLNATPSDAQITIDGKPVVDNRQPVTLLPGVHFVHASAPGYAANAFTVNVAQRDVIAVPLKAIDKSDPVHRVGPAWVSGDLRPHTRSGQIAIRAVLARLKGNVAIVVATSGQDGATARAITADQVGPAVRGATAADALNRALAQVSSEGRLIDPSAVVLDGAATDKTSKSVPVYRRWWFWLGVGASAAVAIGVGRARREPERLRIFAPLATQE